MGQNPLLSRAFKIPFDQIEAEHVVGAIDTLLAEAATQLDALTQNSAPPSFENTLTALEDLTEGLEYAMGIVSHLESVATAPALREAYNAVQPRVSEFYSGLPLHGPLWKRLQAFSETPQAKELSGEAARLLSKTLDEFRRHGANLEAEAKAELSAVEVELSRLTTKFAENVLDSSGAFELLITDEARLRGLPDSALDAARQDAREHDQEGWRFTLQEPSVVPVLKYLDDAELRQTIWRAYNTRASKAPHDNRELIEHILTARAKRAEILGYENFVDLVLEDRMAQSAQRARRFVDDLAERSASSFESEAEQLLAFRRELEGEQAPTLDPWDLSYYSEKLRQARYDFDEEQLRPYFPVDRVLDGMFELVQRLYGVEVALVADFPTWDSRVRTYELSEGGRRLGVFYADLEPRESKRAGAWMNGLIVGKPLASGAADGGDSAPAPDPALGPHLGLICGNLTQPIGDKPALLTHREVETIFHEFGHLLHHLLTRVHTRSLAGTNVAWDFVELPSQIMENWCWEREALGLFARHYETDEPIPDELFEKLRSARVFRSASAMMRQLGFATMDLALHCDFDPQKDGSVLDYARTLAQRFSPATLPEDHAMLCGFLHLFAHPVGYAGAYYSYKWAEVLDADAFTAFREGGVFSRETGTRFRNTILSRGDSREPLELYVEFMGREPELAPLLERSGLLAG